MDLKPGLQRPTPELTEEGKKVETFNPLWHNGEFLGPNAARLKHADENTERKEGTVT